ncbi:MAG: cytochrome P450 [Acidimicrobiia bacterium]|nr:cytochrome P450 [Acidimicrobiia bacterium]MYG58492.1 cytochrome P450 [Acidimicrobiia bacterium]MYJ33742.1 cytochrome P450 [Acidimicrobiia bacterium]
MSEGIYWDPYDREIDANPHPVWKRMRDEMPLYYNERYNFYALSRYMDVREACNDWETYTSRFGTVLELIDAGPENLPTMVPINYDPPLHTAYRSHLGRAFTPRRMSVLEGEIRDLVCEYLDAHVGSGGFDYATEVAKRLPAHVLGMLLGIPEEDRDYLRMLAEAMLHRDEGEEEWNFDAQEKIVEYLMGHTELRRRDPQEDLTTTIVQAEIEDPETGEIRGLTDAELLGCLTLVIGAGNDTTSNLLGWMVYLMSLHPAERQKILDDPSLIPNAIEETLRFESPSTRQARVVTRDVEHYGQTVAEGSRVIVLNASANRDERVFSDPDPDVYAVDRKIDQTLAFGHGIHFCIGAALTRLEGRIALEETLKRFPTWEVDLDGAELKHTSTVRGWNRLPIVY